MISLIMTVLGFLGNPNTILGKALDLWAKSKDVDLEKFKTSVTTSADLAAHIVDANQRFAETQERYATSVLNWWPFRVILFILLFLPATHFGLIVIDSMRPHLFGWRPLGIPPVPPPYDSIEQQLLLFFVIAKPVDTAVGGLISIVTKYLRR